MHACYYMLVSTMYARVLLYTLVSMLYASLLSSLALPLPLPPAIPSSLTSYIKQCVTFLIEGCISCEVFVAECLPSLLTLVADKVPNVRLSLAKTIKESLVNIGKA